jgi:serine/threonine-protein kinase
MSQPPVGPGANPLFLAFQDALAGRYSIDRELGRGGMGIVYLAHEVRLDRLVAIKLLPPERAAVDAMRERFLREARLAAKLSHPNVIPIHSVEERDGFVFYVMAYVEGETLAHRVRTRGPLSSSDGSRVLREAAWALAYAHEQGLVHRDVKPDNILLETGTGRALVADFGIAAAAGDASADGVAGTPEFMSPEQVLGKQLDARSDLYGLGATAFFAFTGRFPFEGATATEVLAKQVTEPAPALASLGLAVPRRLAAIVDRCLAKDPEQRPANGHDLAEQIGAALEQRRELPAALRAFVKRTGRLNGGGTLIAGALLLPLSINVSAWFGGKAGFAAFVLGLTAAPFAYLVASARRLMLMGFSHVDVEPAFRAEIEQAREELSVEQRRGPSRIETFVRRFAKGSAALGLASIAVVIYDLIFRLPIPVGRWLAAYVQVVTVASFGAAIFASIALVALIQRHRDVDTDLWARVWTGRIGKLAFAIARKLLGSRARQVAVTHRATELSLGMAAEQLFESLSREDRDALRDLPPLLLRLQQDAQALRRRYDNLQEAVSSGDPSSPDYAELRELRDQTGGKLADVVATLESIRLNLLRLHAGSATVEGVTTHLDIASEVSEQVERLIAAHDDVDRIMRFPRLPVVSPT